MHAALFALMLAVQCPNGSPPPCAGRAAAIAAPPRSVGVLYFLNRSIDSADAYLADGLTEGIITRLSRVGRLEVKSASAVQRFRGRTPPPDSTGRALRVANLVSGSVARSGNRLRVSVELVRATTGVTLWAGEFNGADMELFDIQTAIADTVAREIAGRLLPGERTALGERRAVAPEAYDQLLQGNYRLARRTPDDVRAAIRHYESAVRIDPAYAAAHARIALAYAVALDWGWNSFATQGAIRTGLAATSRALELDSALADAWTARGYILKFANARTYFGVREAFTRAIRLAPRDAEAHLQYGFAVAAMGDFDGAITLLQRAIALDPERVVTRFTIAMVLDVARRPGAVAHLDTALAMEPGAGSLRGLRAWARLIAGDTAGARSDMREESADEIRFASSALASLTARSGDTARARALAARYAGEWAPSPARLTWGAAWAAIAFAAVGDAPAALDLLERIEPQGLQIWFVTQMPGFDPIRSDPAFQRFVAELAPPRRP